MPCLSLHKAIVLLDGLCRVISVLVRWNAAVQVIVAFITSICFSHFFKQIAPQDNNHLS